MRGHEHVIALRHRGMAPSCVWIEDMGPVQRGLDTAEATWWAGSTQARIAIEPTENPQRIDLRFVVGLVVHLQSTDDRRLQLLAENALEAGAKRVVGTLFAGFELDAPVLRITDSLNDLVRDFDA